MKLCFFLSFFWCLICSDYERPIVNCKESIRTMSCQNLKKLTQWVKRLIILINSTIILFFINLGLYLISTSAQTNASKLSNFLKMPQVCAPSCHDCSTLRAWWEEDEDRRQRYFKNVVGSDMLPPSQCVPEIVHFIIRQHFEAPSMWAIFPLQVSCYFRPKLQI